MMTAPSAETSIDRTGARIERQLRLMWQAEVDCRPWQQLLRQARLRPTRQRVALCRLLFQKGDRHITAEALYDEAVRANMPVALATVYNTLNQLTEAGLLRQIGVNGSKSFFDTNPSEHHHFFLEEEDSLLDIPPTAPLLEKLPRIPEGFEITGVAVVVRLRRRPNGR